MKVNMTWVEILHGRCHKIVDKYEVPVYKIISTYLTSMYVSFLMLIVMDVPSKTDGTFFFGAQGLPSLM